MNADTEKLIADLRALVTEARIATKDLRAVVREARELREVRFAEEYDRELTAAVTRLHNDVTAQVVASRTGIKRYVKEESERIIAAIGDVPAHVFRSIMAEIIIPSDEVNFRNAERVTNPLSKHEFVYPNGRKKRS